MKKIFLLLGAIFAINILVITPKLFAADSAQSSVCEGIGIANGGGSCDGEEVTGVKVNSVIHTVVSLLSYIVGVASVIMIIISSFKYITSGGDSAKIGNAKTTLVYALIGVAIAALAQVLVLFVFRQATTTGSNTGVPTTSDTSIPRTGSNICPAGQTRC